MISHTFSMAAVGLIFMGISTAFASGSMDALAVEDTVKRDGEAAMSKAVSTLQVCACVGVAGGAFLAGILPYTQGYELHLLLKIIVGLLTMTASIWLQEEILQSRQRMSLKMHVAEMWKGFQESGIMRFLAVCIVVISMVQASIETYWQPQLAIIQSQNLQNILGSLSSLAYLATVFGCFIIGRLKIDRNNQSRKIYLTAGCGILLAVVVLSLVKDTILFAIIYIATYMLIGILSVAEQTIINQETEDEVRASVLSVTSFLVRMGGTLSGAVSSCILIFGNIGDVWRILASIALVVILLNMVRTRRIRRTGI